jgi:hypothetical protein
MSLRWNICPFLIWLCSWNSSLKEMFLPQMGRAKANHRQITCRILKWRDYWNKEGRKERKKERKNQTMGERNLTEIKRKHTTAFTVTKIHRVTSEMWPCAGIFKGFITCGRLDMCRARRNHLAALQTASHCFSVGFSRKWGHRDS